ncbi:MAG: alpha/beta hydrolase [Planctomycetota bacterium]
MRLLALFPVWVGAFCLAGCGPPQLIADLGNEGIKRLETVPSATPEPMSYLRAGDPNGRRLIFVHGTPGDATNYLGYLAEPPAGWEVISVDRPGFGNSPADGKTSLTFAGQAAAVEPLLVERNRKKPVLVGHSLGGPIVLRLAADQPDAVGGVVVLAGSVDPDLEYPRWYNVMGAIPPISWLLPGAMRRANDEVYAAQEGTRRLAKDLNRVVCPVVIVHGQRDALVPVGNAHFLLEALPNAARLRLFLLPRAGHFLPWEHGPTVRRAIEEAAR